MTVKIFGISLPPEILKRVDEVRGDVPRSKYLQRLVEHDLAARVTQETQS